MWQGIEVGGAMRAQHAGVSCRGVLGGGIQSNDKAVGRCIEEAEALWSENCAEPTWGYKWKTGSRVCVWG